MSATQRKIWCDDDNHKEYKYFSDFNDWLDNKEGQSLHVELNSDGLSHPSKPLFVSDREAYDQAFIQFRNQKRHEALNEAYFVEQFDSKHWFQRSLDYL